MVAPLLSDCVQRMNCFICSCNVLPTAGVAHAADASLTAETPLWDCVRLLWYAFRGIMNEVIIIIRALPAVPALTEPVPIRSRPSAACADPTPGH